MSGVLRRILILVGSLSLLALSLPAVAGEGTEGGDPPPADDPHLVSYYESVVHVVIYGFEAPGDDPLDCTLPEGVTVAIDPDGEVEVSGDLPEGCSALNVEGPNGQVNHGTFVSAFVHALKAGFEGDTPFGRYVRQFGKSDLGKGDDHVKGKKNP